MEFKKINKDPSPLKAILVGGNEAFFKKIKNFLHNECKIRIAGTYLDKYDAPHYIDSSLYSKTLVFFSTNKTGVIFSPLLRKGLEVLNGKEISPYKNYDNIIRLRINTLLHYDTLIGIDTTFFPSKNDFKTGVMNFLQKKKPEFLGE